MANENLNSVEEKDFKMRKMHPKRDFLIKKVTIPTLIVGGITGGFISALLNSNIVAGGKYAFMQIYSNPAMNVVPSVLLGVGIGAVASVGTIIGFKALVKAIYKKNAKKDYANLKAGCNIESLQISKFIKKIEKANSKISKLSESKNPFKWAYKHLLNAINRDRLHALSDYTIDMVKLYRQNSDDTAIIDILRKIEDSINKNIEYSKSNSQKTIENIDIYAGLKIYLEKVTETENKIIIKDQVKTAKRFIKNLTEKKSVATDILQNGRFILKMISHENVETDTNDIIEEIVETNTTPIIPATTPIQPVTPIIPLESVTPVQPPVQPPKPIIERKPDPIVDRVKDNGDGTITYEYYDENGALESYSFKVKELEKCGISKEKAMSAKSFKIVSRSKFRFSFDEDKTKTIEITLSQDEIRAHRNNLLEKLQQKDFLDKVNPDKKYSSTTVKSLIRKLTESKEQGKTFKLQRNSNIYFLYEDATRLLAEDEVVIENNV